MSLGSFLGVAALAAGLVVVPSASAEELPDSPGTNQTSPRETAKPPVAMDDAPQRSATPKPKKLDAPAAAGDLIVDVSQTTGTAPFDANDEPGNDSGANNSIVRTNDTVAYDLTVAFRDAKQTNPVVKFQVPQGQELVSLPPYCLAAPKSSVVPAKLPELAQPLTATSWKSLPRQEVTCALVDRDPNTTEIYQFVTKVRSEVPNGTKMDPMVFEVSSDQVTEAKKTEPVSQTASARPQFDLSKRAFSDSPSQGPLFQNTYPCLRDQSKPCSSLAYPVTITVPAGGKGLTPLSSPIKFEDNLDPASFYGPTLWAKMVATTGGDQAAARAAYAPSLRDCGPVGQTSVFSSSLPYSRKDMATYANEANSARNSGTISCQKGGAPGQNAVITITGADTTAATVPTTTGNGNSLPASPGVVISFELSVEFPQEVLTKFADDGTGIFTINTHNEFKNVEMTGIDGSANTGENPANNDRDATVRVQTDGSFDKQFTGVYGTPGNTPAPQFSNGPFYEGPPGSGKRKDGNTVVMPGQAVQSVLLINNNSIAGSGTQFSRTLSTCDVWDPKRLALAANPAWHGWNANLYPSNGQPVFPSFFRHAGTDMEASSIGTPLSGVKNLKIEYSSGPAGAGAASDCSSGTWVDSPDKVAGVKQSMKDGTTMWEGVNRVRVTFNTDFPAGTTFSNIGINFAIGQVVLDSADPAPIGNWASQVYTTGVKTVGELFADPKRRNLVPSYNPGSHQGTYGDRLIQGKALVRVKKLVEDPATGQFTKTAVPTYNAGATVRYRLDPSLTTSVPVAGSTAPVVIEDCLPPGQTFKGATQAGKNIIPTTTQPADSELRCDGGRQYLRFDLGTVPIGQPIDPIVVSTEILATTQNGVYTNETLASSSADKSPAAARSDNVQMQLLQPAGIKIAKSVDKPLIEVNPKGVQKPRTLTWSVTFANIDVSSRVSNVDVVDVLPANGLNGNSFSGQLRFDSAKPVAGSGITVLYTKTPAGRLNADPAHASNGATGSTLWCDAVSGKRVSGAGTDADCPQTNDAVTGLRFQRAGDFTPSDKFQVDIAMTPVGNKAGDHYRNVTAGRADGVSLGVGPAARTVDVVASNVGDRVWEDLNRNGLQDTGEPGVAGFPVRLVGTDVDGNPVSLSTVTDAKGKYLFTGLASGKYRVIFDTNGLNSNTTFTRQHVGSNPAVDSDANVKTGETQEFTLGINTEDLTLDAGLVVDRKAKVVIDKKFLNATKLDTGNRSTVTYDIQVSNKGTAETTYDLVDKLRFGGSIKVDSASVKNTSPGGIATNSKFDGLTNNSVAKNVKLRGGETHTYRVTVDATVKTTITVAETQCWVTTNEQGGGFLNEAQLTVDGKTISDKGCGEVPKPNPKKPLPITGGNDIGYAAWAGLGVALAGAALLMLRRKQKRSGA